MCVCVSVCVYESVWRDSHTQHTLTHTHIYMSLHYQSVLFCSNLSIYLSIYVNLFFSVSPHTLIHTHTHTHTYIYVSSLSICVILFQSIYISIYLCQSVPLCLSTHTHTHTHSHTHIYICLFITQIDNEETYIYVCV